MTYIWKKSKTKPIFCGKAACTICTASAVVLAKSLHRSFKASKRTRIPFCAAAFAVICKFVFAGNVMQYGGLSHRLVRFANSLVGHFTGGTSIVCIMACTFFAAISGSSIATTAAIGGMMYPELKKYGYPDDYAAMLPAVGGVLGIVIPVVPHMWGTGVGLAAGLQFLANIPPMPLALFPDEPMMEYDLSDHPFRDDLIGWAVRYEDGVIKIPDGPGLGVQVDRSVVERLLIRD